MKDLSFNIQVLIGMNIGGVIDGVSIIDCSLYLKVEIFLLFVENNMELIDSIIVMLGLCFDYYSIVGNNWSLVLNIL